MKQLWVVDYIGSQVPQPEFFPNLEDFNVVAADQFFSIVETDDAGPNSYALLAARCRDYPYVRIAGKPEAGRWVSEGGGEVYIDANGQIVSDGVAVLRSLGHDISEDEEDSADDILHQLDRVF